MKGFESDRERKMRVTARVRENERELLNDYIYRAHIQVKTRVLSRKIFYFDMYKYKH
jgi:hypothetical protein